MVWGTPHALIPTPFRRAWRPRCLPHRRVYDSRLAPFLRLPFPREVVRDLLGITRALYWVERAKPTPDPSRLARLEEIGRQYRRAIEMGTRYEPDTMAGRVARQTAERATTCLGELVAETAELIAPAVAATAARLSRRGR
jgi:hypothetical protein